MAADQLQYAIGNAASTTPASSMSDSATSLALTSDTNFSAKSGEGMVLLDEGLATEEFAYATGKTGSTLTIPLANRGLEGGSAQAHTTAGTVKGIITAGMWNNVIDALVNLVVKSSGAVDTTKVVTPTGTQTLTNKTLTTPVVGGSAGAAPTTAGQLQYDSTSNILKYGNGSSSVELNSTSAWTSYSAVTPTSGTLSDPSFELVFAGVDLTSTIYPGMRIKLTQSTTKYFIVTKVAFSTNTTMTVYGGTDYELISTGTTVVSNFSYSTHKAPPGFPLDPSKWTETTTSTSTDSQSTPTSGTWYNPGSRSLAVPIGIWKLQYECTMLGQINGAAVSVLSTLSTANNSESDTDMTAYVSSQAGTSTDFRAYNTVHREKTLVLTAAETRYLNIKTVTSSMSQIAFDGALSKTIIRAVTAYL